MPLLYFFITLYPASVLAQAGYQCECPAPDQPDNGDELMRADFNLFLKSLKNADGSPVWSVAQVNAIPIGEPVWSYSAPSSRKVADVSGGGAITVVMVWCWAFLSDYFQTRWLIVLAQAVSQLLHILRTVTYLPTRSSVSSRPSFLRYGMYLWVPSTSLVGLGRLSSITSFHCD